MSQKRFDDEIKIRENSPEWDIEIASKVISKVRKSRVKHSITISLSSLAAAAAVIVFALLFVIKEEPVTNYEQLILTQLNGTYKEVFQEELQEISSMNNDSAIEYDSIDQLIDNTLSMR